MANSDSNHQAKGFNKDSVSGTLIVAFCVCLVCAVVVSTAAVALKPLQDQNIEQDRQRNILAAAGLLDATRPVAAQFAAVETRLVDLNTGEYSQAQDIASYNQMKAAKDSATSSSFSELDAVDLAKIGRREDYALVYLVPTESGSLDKVILPIRGYGLWSTLQGFVALESDLNTLSGLGFFAHKETPGLGGEVDNPGWKQTWVGKQAFRNGELAIQVIKGAVAPGTADAEYKVDGLAGATLTTKGVDNLVRFWLGEQGFGPYLDNLRSGRLTTEIGNPGDIR